MDKKISKRESTDDPGKDASQKSSDRIGQLAKEMIFEDSGIWVRKFLMGDLGMSFGVSEWFDQNKAFAFYVVCSLSQHLTGDWGDATEKQQKENDKNLAEKRGYLFSIYTKVDMPAIWIITLQEQNMTAVLFPGEREQVFKKGVENAGK